MTTLDIERLTHRERLELIGELWDILTPEDVGLSAAQTAELGRRMQTFDDDVKAAISWEDFEAALGRRSK